MSNVFWGLVPCDSWVTPGVSSSSRNHHISYRLLEHPHLYHPHACNDPYTLAVFRDSLAGSGSGLVTYYDTDTSPVIAPYTYTLLLHHTMFVYLPLS